MTAAEVRRAPRSRQKQNGRVDLDDFLKLRGMSSIYD